MLIANFPKITLRKLLKLYYDLRKKSDKDW